MIYGNSIGLGTHRRVKADVAEMSPRMWDVLLWLRKKNHPYRVPRREFIDHANEPTTLALFERRLVGCWGYYAGKQGSPDTRAYGLTRFGVALVQGYLEGKKAAAAEYAATPDVKEA